MIDKQMDRKDIQLNRRQAGRLDRRIHSEKTGRERRGKMAGAS